MVFKKDTETWSLTVLTSLVLIVTEGTVESSQLTQLVALELVLAFGDRSSLANYVSTKSLTSCNLEGNSRSQ